MTRRRMAVPGATALLLFLVSSAWLVALAPPAGASLTNPEPPDNLVVEVTRVEIHGPPSDQETIETDYNLTFKLSEDDPNQSDGDLDYHLWLNDTRSSSPMSVVAIPGRLGWVYAPLQFSNSAGNSVWLLRISTNNTAGNEGSLSCGLVVDFRVNASADGTTGYYECGSRIAAPDGVSAITTNVSNDEGDPATVDVRWSVSDDDPDLTNGSYDYWVLFGETPEGITTDPARMLSDGEYTVDSPGVLLTTIEYSGKPDIPFGQFYGVLARDPLTHQRSLPSCGMFVEVNVLYQSGACGDLAAPGVDLGPGEVNFPLTNVTDLANATGLSEGAVGALLGVSFMVGIVGVAFMMAGVVGALAAGAVGLGFMTLLGVMPSYVLVIIFLVAVALVAMRFGGSRGGGE